MANINSSDLNRLYERNTPFWKKTLFWFSIIFCAVIGLLAFVAVNEIYYQGTS